MRVIKPTTVKRHADDHPDAAEALMNWLETAERADWRSIVDVRRTYPHADSVEVASGNTVTVFNIRGNRYRLIVSIKYRWAMVYVLRFLTHAEYDTAKWKDEL
jgi:mRNA interferase HigB